MENSGYERLERKITELEANYENNKSYDTYDLDEQFADLKSDLYDEEGNMSEEEKEFLIKQLDRIKSENDIVEAEDMRDMMFPNGEDD
ncbi:MAG: hypothetical protein ACOH2V_02850 [Candidatus Saccharimonadaceae bacterium]